MGLKEDDFNKIIEIEDSIIDKLGKRERLAPEESRKLMALGANMYATVIQSLVGISLDDETAKRDWENILVHKYILSQTLGRDVGIIVATLDYYKNLKREDKEFRILDRKDLESTYVTMITDGLTGLYNHRYFQEQIDRISRAHAKNNQRMCLLLFDIDDFKNYNDTNGHLAGDLVLAEVARLMYENIRTGSAGSQPGGADRQVDADLPCRYGGEEFAVIMPRTGKKEAREVAERIRESISAFAFPGREYQKLNIVSISGGIAEFPSEANNRKDLIAVADKRLYRAKRRGKNRIELKSAGK